MIDVRTSRTHRMHQREHLATRTSTTDPAAEVHSRVDQIFQAQALCQRRDEQQPRVRDQVRGIEGRVDPVEPMRYSRH